MDDDRERIMHRHLTKWLITAHIYPGMALHAIMPLDDGGVRIATWADMDPDPAKHRDTMDHSYDLELARGMVKHLE